MSAELQIVRHCKDCPEWTHTICCYVFGKFWRDKSHDGTGCAHPLDGVAESWRKAGWTPGEGMSVPIELPMTGGSRPPNQLDLAFDPPPLSDDDY